MPEQIWTNKGERRRIQAVLGKQLNMPVFLVGDQMTGNFTGSWELIDESSAPVAFAVQAPVLDTPEGYTGVWTKVLIKYGATSPEQPQEVGDIYRYSIQQDGADIMYGPLEVLPSV